MRPQSQEEVGDDQMRTQKLARVGSARIPIKRVEQTGVATRDIHGIIRSAHKTMETLDYDLNHNSLQLQKRQCKLYSLSSEFDIYEVDMSKTTSTSTI